ncbi:MAG: DciA family protein [Propionibacteriaceae bacterium]|nr:DciA family protein [Propionibacteriaceae bacterium]
MTSRNLPTNDLPFLEPPDGDQRESDSGSGPDGYRRPHDPTGTDVAERIAAAARGVAPVKHRKRPVQPDPQDVEWSGPGPSGRDPQPAGAVLDAVLTRRGWKKQVSIASLMPRWAEFVGEVNAAHTQPEKWESGVLTVRAESTTWATSLRTMAPQIVARLNEILGPRTVTSLRILGPQAPSWKKGIRSVPGRGPRDTYG